MPYSEAHADRAVAFFRNLKHTKGRWAGVPFDLLPWQEQIVRPLFGTLRDDGTRQYRRVYVEVPKKQGKSELAAGIALYALFADSEPGAECYSAAADRDQASIVFNVAAQMVRQSPALGKRCKIIDSQKRIVVPGTASVYRVLSAEAHTKHGFNVHAVVFDELHAQPDRNLYDVLTEGSGDARTQPIFFFITTAGYDRNSICWEVHDYARKVRDGVIEDPEFLPAIYAADEKDDWHDEATWRKANPSLGITVSMDAFTAAYKRAAEVPALENTFKRLRLNLWTEQETRWLTMESWDACDGPVDAAGLTGRRCYGGLDLATTTDIAAFVLVFPPEEDGELYKLAPYFWIPEEAMKKRSERDRVPYDVWVREKLIEATPGNVIDYGAIMQTIDMAAQQFDIAEVAFDRWGATQISLDLAEQGMTVVPMGQGFASMSAPTKELEKLVLGKQLAHGGNPVLRWMASNVMVEQDAAGNLKPSKSKSREKIDGIVASVMALDRAVRHEKPKPSIYETQGFSAI
ncbi:MAG: terminase large subunit [Deltaproteobacteria bacterium]|nr:terminase large subunit [Deltaproteobacteria bacterium]